jgi:hypothetical protein
MTHWLIAEKKGAPLSAIWKRGDPVFPSHKPEIAIENWLGYSGTRRGVFPFGSIWSGSKNQPGQTLRMSEPDSHGIRLNTDDGLRSGNGREKAKDTGSHQNYLGRFGGEQRNVTPPPQAAVQSIQDADGFVRFPLARAPVGAGMPIQTGQIYPRLV